MIRYTGLAVATAMLLMLINLSCGYSPNIAGEQIYVPPTQLNHPRLLYPKLAQENSYTGNTKVVFDISDAGQVTNASVQQSSGSRLLDNSAVDYCKSLLFEPAKVDGRSVKVKMSMDIKFQISNVDMLANKYVNEVNRLYYILRNSGIADRIPLEREILREHIDFIREMRDALNFNTYAALVLSKDIVEEWKSEWDSWPLSFLIYYDFMQRFPDYDSLQNVKSLMFNALRYDIKYIRSTPDSGIDAKEQKENIIAKIKGFLKVHYPDADINEIESGTDNEGTPLSLSLK